jgi:hypothetical protein
MQFDRLKRPAGVKGHITCKGIVSEPRRSRVSPPALYAMPELPSLHACVRVLDWRIVCLNKP